MNAADATLAAAIDGGVPDLYAVLTARLRAGRSHEQPPWDAELLRRAITCCEEVIAAARADARPLDEALAGIGRAAALLCVDDLASTEQAELGLGAAIGSMPADVPPEVLIDAYQMLADLLVRVIGAVNEDQRDAFIERAIGIAGATEYLASRAGDDAAVARALDARAQALAQRFTGSRDANLMAAVEAALRALGRLTEAQVMAEVRWPLLALEAGNAAMKITTARSRWLTEAQRCHRLGRSAVDTVRYPGLAAVYDRNLALYAPEAAERMARPPDTEMFERFRRRGREAGNDANAALQVAVEMVAWARGLPEQPNPYLGHAHLFAGRVWLGTSVCAEAASAFDAAAQVFAAVFADDATGAKLAAKALELRAQALAGIGSTT